MRKVGVLGTALHWELLEHHVCPVSVIAADRRVFVFADVYSGHRCVRVLPECVCVAGREPKVESLSEKCQCSEGKHGAINVDTLCAQWGSRVQRFRVTGADAIETHEDGRVLRSPLWHMAALMLWISSRRSSYCIFLQAVLSCLLPGF